MLSNSIKTSVFFFQFCPSISRKKTVSLKKKMKKKLLCHVLSTVVSIAFSQIISLKEIHSHCRLVSTRLVRIMAHCGICTQRARDQYFPLGIQPEKFTRSCLMFFPHMMIKSAKAEREREGDPLKVRGGKLAVPPSLARSGPILTVGGECVRPKT